MPRPNDPRIDEIAARLRDARSKIFSSAAEAARALDMKPVTVRAHESGQNGIGYVDLERYARRYGVDVGWLMTGIGDKEPKPGVFQEWGEILEIAGSLQDGVWLPDPVEDWEYAREIPKTVAGGSQTVVYSDPRFPVEMVRAFRVVSNKPNNDYPGDCVVFAISTIETGFRPDDHVIIYLEKSGFTQATLRRVVAGPDRMLFRAITSDEPDLYQGSLGDDVSENVAGLVIGAQIRRRVNLPTIDMLKQVPIP